MIYSYYNLKSKNTYGGKTMKREIRNYSLVDIFKETRKLSKSKFNSETSNAISTTCVYSADYFKQNPITIDYVIDKPAVAFISGGTVSTAMSLKSEHNSLAVLNFADALIPGGMVTLGSSAQEENLCRCSNLYETLIKRLCKRDYYDVNRNVPERAGLYTDTIIYSRGITFFRDDKTYEQINPKTFDVITCPAPSTVLAPSYAEKVYESRINSILSAAILNRVDTIVLGAWGCGAFHQDPVLVAKAFATALNNYANQFNSVVFAIRPTRGSDNYMLDTFYKVFCEYYIGEVLK